MRLIKKSITYFFLLAVFCCPILVKADTVFDLAVTPAVIDIPSCEKGQICLEKTVSIKNNSAVRADIYAQVNDLSSDSGIIPYSDPSQLPADASLVRWIDFYRSVIEINPGSTATQTLRITASPNAQPGKYHAIIAFPAGGNLTEAQLTDQKLNVPKVEINLDLVAHQVNAAEINLFQPAQALFTRNNIGFVLKIKNIGNEPVTPAGEIVIYDKGGREVGSLPVKGAEIAPNEIKDFSTAGTLNIGPGKFKAILNLDYGENNGKNLTDIVYFSYLPLSLFLVFLAIILVLVFIAARYLHKRMRGKGAVAEKKAGLEQLSEPENIHHRHPKYTINLKK